MSELLTKIKSRGYWQVTIRPRAFHANRVEDISNLLPILSKCTVRLRGWDFPHIDSRTRPYLALDWVGQESDWEHHKAVWRFYQSGQFVYILAMGIDWRDESSFWRADESWKPMTLLGVGDSIFTFAEVMELGSRLALTDAGDDQMHINIKLGNISGRLLYVDTHRNRWPFDNEYVAYLQDYPFTLDISRSELVADHKSLALEASRQLFKRFSWDASPEIVLDWYEKRG
jgi:hypothetical protein